MSKSTRKRSNIQNIKHTEGEESDITDSDKSLEGRQISENNQNLDKSTLKIPDYTSTEELNEIRPGDNTVCIVGYIDSILGTKTVGRKRSMSLFKFTINNGENSKITVLLWENQISLYESKIRFREVIQLNHVKALPIDPIYNRRQEGFVNFEISIQRNSEIMFYGPAVLNQISDDKVIEVVEVKYAGAYSGFKSVQGWLSVDFSQVTTGGGSSSFATAAMTDGQYKLRLQFANYAAHPAITLGTNICAKGHLKKDKYGCTLLQIESMSDLTVIDELKMDREFLKRGFRAPLETLGSPP